MPCVRAEYSPVEYLFSYLHLELAKDITRSRASLVMETLHALHSTPTANVKAWWKHTGWV